MNDWDIWEEDFAQEPPSLWDRRRRTFRWIAVIVVIAMILALVVPVIVRVIRRPEPQDRGTVTVLHEPSPGRLPRPAAHSDLEPRSQLAQHAAGGVG